MTHNFDNDQCNEIDYVSRYNNSSQDEIDYPEFINSLTPKLLDYDLTSHDYMLWIVGTRYDMIKFSQTKTPKYKKKQKLFKYNLLRDYDLLYAIYIPCKLTYFRLILNNKIILSDPTLQDDDGYIRFDLPLPLFRMKMKNTDMVDTNDNGKLCIEYMIDENEVKFDNNLMNKLIKIKFVCGYLDYRKRNTGRLKNDANIIKDIYITNSNSSSCLWTIKKSDKDITIIIEGLERVTIKVKSSDTIENIKKMIEYKRDVPLNRINLYFNTIQLKNNYTIGDYDIQEGYTLWLCSEI